MKKRGKAPGGEVGRRERPIPEDAYPVIDNDLARDNLENDLSSADLQNL